jgi:HAT1-interacting factor 1
VSSYNHPFGTIWMLTGGLAHEQDAEMAEGEEEEEDDDLAVAFEILELSRVLLTKKLEEVMAAEPTGPSDEAEDKGKEVAAVAAEGDSPAVKHVKERLADAHDLLAEISLENERYLSHHPSRCRLSP